MIPGNYRGEMLTLREASLEDLKTLLEWRNDTETRKYSHSSQSIEPESHKKWLSQVMRDDKRKLYIAIEGNEPVGTVRADYDIETDAYVLSWTTAPEHRGKGVGKRMVKLLVDKLQSRVRAEIKDGNQASINIAEYAGLRFKELKNNIYHYSNFDNTLPGN
jgi:RimJ/RimL family protein N-acetyltransferase